MKTYRVTIIEKLEMTVEVEAIGRYEAERLTEKQWEDGKYILNADHFKDVMFNAALVKKERGMEY